MKTLLMLMAFCACLTAQPLEKKVEIRRNFSGDPKATYAPTHQFFSTFSTEFSKAFFSKNAPADKIKPGWRIVLSLTCGHDGHTRDSMSLVLTHANFKGSELNLLLLDYEESAIPEMATQAAEKIWQHILLLQEYPKNPPPPFA